MEAWRIEGLESKFESSLMIESKRGERPLELCVNWDAMARVASSELSKQFDKYWIVVTSLAQVSCDIGRDIMDESPWVFVVVEVGWLRQLVIVFDRESVSTGVATKIA